MAATEHEALALTLHDSEFAAIQKLAYRVAGISIGPAKKALVVTRLSKRVRELRLASFQDYVRLIGQSDRAAELQTAIDLLTTNETHFFRESAHFDFLRTRLLPQRRAGETFRVWSAACSSGEEPYTLAIVLADALGEQGWEVLGSDISTRVLARAAAAEYPLERARSIPQPLLHKYCLRGIGAKSGTFQIDRTLRQRVQIRPINLVQPLPTVGPFDVIFLRNVMIYFDTATKAQVVQQLAGALKPGGWFIISHCETLNGVTDALTMVQPSIYRVPSLR